MMPWESVAGKLRDLFTGRPWPLPPELASPESLAKALVRAGSAAWDAARGSAPTDPFGIAITVLVVWATAGLLFVHLAVLLVRGVTTPFRRRRTLRPTGPPAKGPSFAFIIPVYNDAMTLGPTIESCLLQTKAATRILVVDDGSTDASRTVAERYRKFGVEVLAMPRNGGKTRAVEAAVAHLDTELVAVVDADSLVDRRYVAEMLGVFADPELAAAGGSVESIPHTWITATRQLEYMVTVNVDRAAESEMSSIVVLPGVSTTFRRRVLAELGFEHDTIAEDFDLTFRLQKAGKKLRMHLRAKVYTSDPPTMRAYWQQVVRWYTDLWIVLKKHRDILGRKVFGTVEVPLLVLNSLAVCLLYFVLTPYFALTDPGRLAWMFLTGTAIDVALIVTAAIVYRRLDVGWALLGRYPTRILGRTAFLYAMARVLVGRPGKVWRKLERRSTDAFLAKISGPAGERAADAGPEALRSPPGPPAGTE